MKEMIITSVIPGAALIVGAVISHQTGNGLVLLGTFAGALMWSVGGAAVFMWRDRHVQYTAEQLQLFKMITW